MRILITGAAGLVGQNLIARMRDRGFHDIVAVDKHKANVGVLRRLHPEITVVEADLAESSPVWENALDDAEVVVVGHAQIGGLDPQEFERNNIIATRRLLEAVARRGGRRLVHISSSVVNSRAVDWYTETKKAQEALVLQSGNPCVVLRPTLMFGWFDRKHLGWLSRFMRKAPFFPVPGHGRYLRQPLYVGDFCGVIEACIGRADLAGVYDISGRERIDYIDLIRLVRDASGARTPIVKIPYRLFWAMLATYALIDRDPPFTVKQLEALVTPDEFAVIDWPSIFGVAATPLAEAVGETFGDQRYSSVVLDF